MTVNSHYKPPRAEWSGHLTYSYTNSVATLFQLANSYVFFYQYNKKQRWNIYHRKCYFSCNFSIICIPLCNLWLTRCKVGTNEAHWSTVEHKADGRGPLVACHKDTQISVQVPYFSIDNAHLMYNAHPKLFRHSFWCTDNAYDVFFDR